MSFLTTRGLVTHDSPEVMLLAADLYEDFTDEEGIALATVLSFQPSSV